MQKDYAIQIRSGVLFYPLRPDPALIDIADQARVLDRLPRWGGNTRNVYSACEHSINVAELVAEDGADTPVRLAALLHDFHECLTGFGDVVRPAKDLCPLIKEIEKGLDQVIGPLAGIDPALFLHPAVRQADNVMGATEGRFLMAGPRWEGWDARPLDAMPEPYGAPVQRFMQLYKQWGGK